MISADLLETGLRTAAEDYDLPAGGVEAIRARAGAMDDKRLTARLRRELAGVPRPRSAGAWTALVAAALVLLIGLPLAVGTLASSPTESAGSGSESASVPQRDALTPPNAHKEAAGAVGRAAPATHRGEPAPGAGRATQVAPARERIVKTGELALRAAKGQVGATLGRLSALATRDGGFVQSSSSETAGSAPSGQVTLRVPVARFDEALRAASHLSGTTVGTLRTQGRDVTGAYVDLSARITALEKTRATYLTILGHAKTIGSVLEVQDRISDVQTQIDQLQGQRKLLASQSAMSTLAVSVDQPGGAPPARHHRSGFSAAVHQSIRRFERGVDDIVSIVGPLLLVVLVLGVVGGVGWLGARQLRRRMV